MSQNKEAFARMAANSNRSHMIIPEPVQHINKSCVLTEGSVEPCAMLKKPSTAEELKEALKELRNQYTPFLADYAPEPKSTRQIFPIKKFILDGDKEIEIPYYGGPLGNAVQHYITEFFLPEFGGNAVYFCCGGADYKAAIYINERCVGMHEGFFSPFEFEITRYAVPGVNRLEIVLENDFSFMGNSLEGEAGTVVFQGDKLYAATGLGFNDPIVGWHHCPPGMGLYHSVSIEIRKTLHITDVFTRPDLENQMAEIWIEVENTTYDTVPLEFRLSLYGQNFKKTVFEDLTIVPLFMEKALPAKHGRHVYKVLIDVPEARIWSPDQPWLYQLQVSVIHQDSVCDTMVSQFGMRSFIQDVSSEPKGMFYLNGEPIRLRGANTMGFEQQDVMNEDYDQLIDDILLAKLCNMNFFRITQRPVQDEVYQYCDRLGLMTQCDFPLFGVMRRTKACEGIRQVEEMIRMVRKHPCNIVVTYINEPWINANGEPHRHMLRDEMEDLFEMFDRIVHYNHPDCVIKHVDGDFDPPTRDTMPDVHCYNLWYNGAQQDFGLLHRGYGQPVAPGWLYGCGEYGAEGLDFPDVMRECYPASWTEEPFDPGKIVSAQAKELHGSFIDTPDTLEEWSYATQAHQAFAMKYMTEAYRRDPRMVSTALFYFIDTWPAGWMKAIMDYRRTPKQAFFTSRDAYEPLLLSLRSDRFTYYAGEKISIETFVCNDTNVPSEEGCRLVFQLYNDENHMCMYGETDAVYDSCTVTYMTNVEFAAPNVTDRIRYELKAFLLAPDGSTIADQTFAFTVFSDVKIPENQDIIWITSLENGIHEIAGETVTVETCPHGPKYFLSRKTGHPAVAGFQPDDFRMWYDKDLDRLAPMANQCFYAEGFKPILICNGSYTPGIVVGEKMFEGKRYIISLADLRYENPIAKWFYHNLVCLSEI